MWLALGKQKARVTKTRASTPSSRGHHKDMVAYRTMSPNVMAGDVASTMTLGHGALCTAP